MRVPAITYRAAGGTEVIALGETDVREPGGGEVVVEVAAAGLNRADVLQRQGLYPPPPGVVSDVPGLEFSGRIASVGPAADRFAVGDAVMGLVPGGAMAKRLVVHERELMPVPRGLGVIEAAAIPEAFVTAWDAMDQARLGAGETVVVHAAGSGVGCAALQIAHVLGARAIATSRTPDKLAKLKALGIPADGITTESAKFADQVRHLTSGVGAAVVLDCVGAAYLEENLRALGQRGRLVLIGTLGGGKATLPIGMVLGKRITVIGTVMRSRPLEEKIALAQVASSRLVPLFESGRLRPIIDRVMPMTEVADAHGVMENNANVGKIVLRWT